MLRFNTLLFSILLLSIMVWGVEAAKAPTQLQELYEQFQMLQQQGKQAEAIEVGKRAIEYADSNLPPQDDKKIILRSMLAESYSRFGLYGKAEELYREILSKLVDRYGKIGPAPPFMIQTYIEHARNLSRQGKTKEAERIADDVYQRQQSMDATPSERLDTLATFAEIFAASGSITQVNDTYREIRRLFDESGLANNPDLAPYLFQWAEGITHAFPDQSLELYIEARTLLEDGFQDSPLFLQISTKLGHLYERRSENKKALELYEETLALAREYHGEDSIHFARVAGQLALFLGANGESDRGVKLITGTLKTVASKSGPQSNEYRRFLEQATKMATDTQHLDVAEPWLLELKTLILARSGANSTGLQDFHLLSASLEAKKGRWNSAAAQAEYAALMMINQFNATSDRPYELYQPNPLSFLNDPEAVGGTFLVTALAEGATSVGETRLARLWAAAQLYNQSAAANAFGALFQRMNQPPALRDTIRRRQLLAEELALVERQLLELDTSPRRDQYQEQIQKFEVDKRHMTGEITDIDAILKKDEVATSFANDVTAMQIEDVKNMLGPDEALLMFQDIGSFEGIPQKLYAWVITNSSADIVEILAGPETVRQMVNEVRRQIGVPSMARGLVSFGGGKPLVLNASAYMSSVVLGPFYSKIADKPKLMIVPSRSLSNLPFHVLVQPDKAPERANKWLVEAHSFNMLPSVAALVASRRNTQDFARPPKNAYLAFANPLLLGPLGSDKSAWEREGCNDTRTLQTMPSASPEAVGSAEALEAAISDVSRLEPLPETLDEVCAAAALFGKDSMVRSGANATEDELWALDQNGTLAGYNILHFASHALLSGELGAGSEPAIVLTPSQKATGYDGKLTASEVAGLNIDADWVILSACNTAAGNSKDTEGLSGLARAFLYAGARSLLVTHWPVDSQAAVEISTRTVANFVANPAISKAEALRAAMQSLIKEGGRQAEPQYWAPFVLVGDR